MPPNFSQTSYNITYTVNSGEEIYDLTTLLMLPSTPNCPIDLTIIPNNPLFTLNDFEKFSINQTNRALDG